MGPAEGIGREHAVSEGRDLCGGFQHLGDRSRRLGRIGRLAVPGGGGGDLEQISPRHAVRAGLGVARDDNGRPGLDDGALNGDLEPEIRDDRPPSVIRGGHALGVDPGLVVHGDGRRRPLGGSRHGDR